MWSFCIPFGAVLNLVEFGPSEPVELKSEHHQWLTDNMQGRWTTTWVYDPDPPDSLRDYFLPIISLEAEKDAILLSLFWDGPKPHRTPTFVETTQLTAFRRELK